MKKIIALVGVVACATVTAAAQQIDPAALNKLLDQMAATLQQAKALATTPAPATGATVRVAVGGDVQAAIDAAAPGSTILLAPGAYTTNIVLRKKATAGTITIRTDGLDDAKLPPGVRVVGPTASPSMARLKPKDTFSPVISTDPGVSDYALIGFEVGGNATNPDRDLVVIGNLNYTSVAQLPVNIKLDRMYVHGDPVKGGHRGVLMDAINGSVVNSDVRGFVEVGRDSQAILVANTTGPTRIENTYLEATGENFLTGGVDPRIPNALPSDLTFRGNYVFKPLAWKTTAVGSVKNLLELKLCKRCLIENNVFENTWVDAQNGGGILFTLRNQDLTAPWSTVQDVTFQYNVLKNIQSAGISMLGLEDRPGVISVQGTNIVIRQNLFVNVGNGLSINNGFVPTTVTHNTFATVNNWFLQFTNNAIPSGKFVYQSNVVRSGEYGIVGDGTGLGVPTLDIKAPGAVFTHNVIEKAPYTIAYPAGNYLLDNGTFAAKLDVKLRYLGTEAGHDGQKPGVNVDVLQQRIPWATW